MKPITLESYMPLTEQSCSMLLSNMKLHLSDFIEEQIIVKQKEGIAKEYFSKQNAIARFYEQLVYQKNILSTGEEKTFLEELLDLGTPNSYEEIYMRGFFLDRLYHFLDLSNLEKNVLNIPLPKDSFHIWNKSIEQSTKPSSSTIAYLLNKQMTQDTLVDLFHHSILNPKNSLSYYTTQIKENLNDCSKLNIIINEYWTEFSFSTLREQLALFAVIPLLHNTKTLKSIEIENIVDIFYNTIYENANVVDAHSMRAVLIDLSTQFFDLTSANRNKNSDFSQFMPYKPSDKDFIYALRLFRDEKLLKHLLPYQETIALYKDISLKVKDKDVSQARRNKI